MAASLHEEHRGLRTETGRLTTFPTKRQGGIFIFFTYQNVYSPHRFRFTLRVSGKKREGKDAFISVRLLLICLSHSHYSNGFINSPVMVLSTMSNLQQHGPGISQGAQQHLYSWALPMRCWRVCHWTRSDEMKDLGLGQKERKPGSPVISHGPLGVKVHCPCGHLVTLMLVP